jgi:hypothetical protein
MTDLTGKPAPSLVNYHDYELEALEIFLDTFPDDSQELEAFKQERLRTMKERDEHNKQVPNFMAGLEREKREAKDQLRGAKTRKSYPVVVAELIAGS